MQRDQLAERREQTGRRDDRGDAEQQRDAGRDERAERDQEDQQRPAHRDLLLLGLVLALLRSEGVALRRAAVLLDAQLGMGLLDGGDGRDGLLRELLARLLLLDGLDLAG